MTPKPDDGTSMGGGRSVFLKTRWSDIRNARTSNEARQRDVVDGLIRSYWKPVYCYLRRKGHANALAKDLTQGFFHNVVLGRNLFERADETKGRFRTFLLTALNRYVTSAYRHKIAEKRRPKDGVVSLEDFDETPLAATAKTMSPDDAFTYVWASVLLQEVLAEVEQRCSRDDKALHWQVFHARILGPIMAGAEPESLAGLCKRLGIENTAKAANMIVTVKRRFQAAIKDRVRRYVDSDEEVEQEIRDLMKILSKQRAS
ncbi:MAG: sigma-70 family RNA polymerase sigma factor [Planctomycetes bacterium]|nr:sigma-70 family RNA polymerase sigma factor [Planctomycetota bacterium]